MLSHIAERLGCQSAALDPERALEPWMRLP